MKKTLFFNPQQLTITPLILFESKQLSSKEFCTNHPSVPFKNVPLEAVKELKRIFSDKMVVIK